MTKRLFVFIFCVLFVAVSGRAVSSADIPLKPTLAAPRGASGEASFEKESGGVTLKAELRQVTPGQYRLSAVKRSDGAVITLGHFSVADPTLAPDREATDNRKEDSTTHQSAALQTQIKAPLPPGLASTDIAEIRVSDSGGNVLLSGKSPPVSQQPAD